MTNRMIIRFICSVLTFVASSDQLATPNGGRMNIPSVLWVTEWRLGGRIDGQLRDW